MPEEFLDVNRALWDEVAHLHRESYVADELVADPQRLSTQVIQDLPLLEPFLPGGTVAGLDMIHLQCHIGTDTLSWARLGARMTGLDMSGESLRIARELAREAGLDYTALTGTGPGGRVPDHRPPDRRHGQRAGAQGGFGARPRRPGDVHPVRARRARTG